MATMTIAMDGPATMRLAPYLFFTTQCEEALTFYADCGLGTTSEVLRHGENGMPVHREDMRGRIAHCLFSGPGIHFYASDNHDAEPMRGFALMFDLTDRQQTTGLFQCLCAGGTITTPLGIQPWGDFYDKLTDRFGVQWMFNCRTKNR
jgi:PhnB protein